MVTVTRHLNLVTGKGWVLYHRTYLLIDRFTWFTVDMIPLFQVSRMFTWPASSHEVSVPCICDKPPWRRNGNYIFDLSPDHEHFVRLEVWSAWYLRASSIWKHKVSSACIPWVVIDGGTQELTFTFSTKDSELPIDRNPMHPAILDTALITWYVLELADVYRINRVILSSTRVYFCLKTYLHAVSWRKVL